MNQMLAMDAKSARKKARAAVNPLAGLRLASALTAAWCCEKIEICSGGKIISSRPACIRCAYTSSASENKAAPKSEIIGSTFAAR